MISTIPAKVRVPPMYRMVTITKVPVAAIGIKNVYPTIANPITSIATPGIKISFLNIVEVQYAYTFIKFLSETITLVLYLGNNHFSESYSGKFK
jgi:hypothetical protein